MSDAQNYLARRLTLARPYQEAAWAERVNELDVLAVDGKRIKLSDGRELTEFVSCSYLGLDQRPELRAGAHEAVDRFGVQMSAARTRIRASMFGDLDELLSSILGCWHTVTFASVSAVHLAVIPILASGELPGYRVAPGGPAFLIDRSAHASLQVLRGIMAQFGPVERVDFLDLDRVATLARTLSCSGRTVVTISDSVGSMGGTVDVPAVSALMEELDGFAYFDDAHGTSVIGKSGQGYVFASTQGCPSRRVVMVGSLSKAFGATGGMVALPTREAATFIKRYAVPYVFGGPPSLPAIGAAVASANLHLDGTVDALQMRLRQNTELFDAILSRPCINSRSASPIRGIPIGDEHQAISATKALHERGYAVTAAMYPTVAAGRAMLRLALSASHTNEDVRGIVAALNMALDR